MQAGWTDLGSFDMGIGDTHTNFRRMVAKQGAIAKKQWWIAKRQGSFVRPIVCQIVCSSDSLKDGKQKIG